MNNNSVLLQINSTISYLRTLKASIGELPERTQRKIAGAAHIDQAIRGLEAAKAEMAGEALPVASLPADFDVIAAA